MSRITFGGGSSLTLTIRISDSDNPDRFRERVVMANDLWGAIHELKNVAGPDFARELMNLSWSLLVTPPVDPPDAGVLAGRS